MAFPWLHSAGFGDLVTGEERIASLESQIASCARGESKSITCPYCEAVNVSDNERLCCTLMAKAVKAIIERERLRDVQEKVSRIMENAEMN